MPKQSTELSFETLFQRLIETLRLQIATGSLTVRRLANQIGVSQPHMQNLISGKRALTVEMADRLLEFLRHSPLELATGPELGKALERVAPTPELIRYVPLLAGLLGPAHPFPVLDERAAWIPLPAHSIGHLLKPVFAEVGVDAEVARDFPGAAYTLLELAVHTRMQIRRDAWYALRWAGGGWLRRLRYEPGRLIVLGQEGLRTTIGPEWIDLRGETVDAYIQGRVAWMGGDPRRYNPLAESGYLILPAADS